MIRKKLLIFSFPFLIGAGHISASPGSSIQDTTHKFIRKNNPIKESYIVVLNEREMNLLYKDQGLDRITKIDDISSEISEKHQGKRQLVYTHALAGFSITMSEQNALAMSREGVIEYIEEDAMASVSMAEQSNATWGLDRIDQRDRPLNKTYKYAATGKGVSAYIIDTGIRYSHSEFGGRATLGYDGIDKGGTGADCQGHGTHVAGTVGGKIYGVAKDVKLYAVRVADCNGRGPISTVIAGVDWVTKNRKLPAVANMSLSAAVSTSLDQAVRNSIQSGVAYVVSASNDAADACTKSPARTPEAITVGSSTSSDARSSFSNYGTCVDIFAPGSSITSASYSSNTGTSVMSGTSMASPHVTGAVALYFEFNPTATPSMAAESLKAKASRNRLTSIGAGSPNLLLYTDPSQEPPPPPPPPCLL